MTATPTPAEREQAKRLAYLHPGFSPGRVNAIAQALADVRAESATDRPWVEAQALDDAADDLLGAMGADSDYWDREDVFRWLTDRSGCLRQKARGDQ